MVDGVTRGTMVCVCVCVCISLHVTAALYGARSTTRMDVFGGVCVCGRVRAVDQSPLSPLRVILCVHPLYQRSHTDTHRFIYPWRT